MVLADWAGIAIDNARLFEGVQARRDELERAVQGLEATTAIVRAIGTETDLDRVLELIVKRGRDLVEARSLVLLLAEGAELIVAAGAGQIQQRVVGSRFPSAGPRPERCCPPRARRACTTPGRCASSRTPGSGWWARRPACSSRSSTAGRRVGMLAAFDSLTGDGGFDAAQEALLVTFAASAATAVASAKTVERERLRDSLKAAESERRRWARELHDDTLQGLAGLQVLLSAAGPAADRAMVDRSLALAAGQIQEQIDGLRTLITELRPAALDQFGLQPALESLLNRLGTVEGLDVTGELALGLRRLDPELETTIYRFVQEALTNVAKHARAEHVRVRLTAAPDTIEIEIADDGRGFDPAQRGEGFGLLGMHERAALYGGDMQVQSSGTGTTVRASIPVAA